jgi:hypothetical protein
MGSTEAFPHDARAGRDLVDLVHELGPFLTVVLTTEPAIENAAQRSKLRWRGLRSELAERGAPDGVLAMIDPIVADAHTQGRTLVVVANRDAVLHVEHGDDPEDPDDHADGWWDELPRLLPILSLRRAEIPHVVVLIDRSGADLVGARLEAPEVREEVEPETEPMARSHPGGWSQRRFQQRAENSWEQGAGEVAEEVVKLVDRVDPSVVIVAGDVRAVGFLREALPEEIDARVRGIEGGRPRGPGQDVPDDVRVVVRDAVREEDERVLSRFEEEIGQGDLAVQGVHGTVAALAKGQAEVLLVRDDRDDDRRVWIGPEPTALGLRREELEASGVDEPREARLVDALVRAALGTSAAIRPLPGDRGPEDGVGALLRWSDVG